MIERCRMHMMTAMCNHNFIAQSDEMTVCHPNSNCNIVEPEKWHLLGFGVNRLTLIVKDTLTLLYFICKV